MKTSEALRLADEMGLPDLRDDFVAEFVEDWPGDKPPCCAIGGAAIAAGLQIVPENDVVPNEQWEAARNPNTSDWKALRRAKTACPITDCHAVEPTAEYVIIHLYDDHEWSRTEIADWLDTLELPA